MIANVRRLLPRCMMLRHRPLTVALGVVLFNLLLIMMHQARMASIIGGGGQGRRGGRGGDAAAAAAAAVPAGVSYDHANTKKLLTPPVHAPLTIFTILKEFGSDADASTLSEEDKRKRLLGLTGSSNAIRSWVAMSADVDVQLFADEATCDRFMGFVLPFGRGRCDPIPCYHETIGAPTYDCLFAMAAERSSAAYLMYANADMVFFPDLLHAVNTVDERFPGKFVMVGHRHDVDYPHAIDFNNTASVSRFMKRISETAVLHGRYGIDFFLFRRQHTPVMPPFLVGRIQWDNWLLSRSIRDPDVATVEVSGVVLAVHMNHGVVGVSHERSGTGVNKVLAGDKRVLALGALDETDYRMVPKDRNKRRAVCDACNVEKNGQSLDVVLYKQASEEPGWEKTIIIASVNFGYIDFSINWFCSLQRVGVTNFLFHAMDEAIYQQLLELGMPVFLYVSPIAQQILAGKDATNYDYGSVEYQALMNSRTDFIFQVLKKNYHAVLCDVDIVILKNPFHFLDFKLDIHGQQHKKLKVSGGFLFLRATEKTKGVWRSVLYQHRSLLQQIQHMDTFDPHSNTEQSLLNKILLKAKPSQISWGTIVPEVIADGKRFFIDQDTQRLGEWPAAVHNNYIVGKEGKIKRFQLADLWFVNEKLECRPPFKLVAPPKESFSLTIKVLAYDRPDALERLLSSLLEAEFDGDRVSLDIFIDRPRTKTDEDGAELPPPDGWVQTVAKAKAFQWPHGAHKLVVREENVGLAGQWLTCWKPTSDAEVGLILEDDNVVSPVFYRWLKQATEQYFLDPDTFDPRLYGIALQKQHMIAGKYPKRPVIDDGRHLYLYQLGSTWGPVFFPKHWAEFTAWFAERSAQPDFQPLFSNLITNKWYLARGGGKSVWSAWFIRFVAERGWYGLYTNFPGDRALVVNYRDSGNNFKESLGPNSKMMSSYDPVLTRFPPLRTLPLYDFHFNRIYEGRVLEGRAFYSDIQDEYPK